MRILCLLLLIGSALPAAAQVYRHVDEKGVVHYTDKPPSKNARPVTLPPLQTYPAGTPPAALVEPEAPPAEPAEGGAAADGRRFKVEITSPAPDAVYRDPSGIVAVAASVTPGLSPGFGLRYYVDGAAATAAPVQSTAFTLAGLERGAHVIAVAVVDERGRELARSAPVTVHLKPPAARPQAVPRAR